MAQSKQTPQGKEERKKRVPLGAQRMKGKVENLDPKYKGRWINDTPGRIQMALEGGYQFVTAESVVVGEGDYNGGDFSSMKHQHGGHDASGKPYRRYFMAIRRELYDEDQAFKQSELDEVDESIRAGKYKLGADSDKSYVPKDGIKIS